MKTKNNITQPNPREVEKEISDFLSQKYGDQVKIVSPIVMPKHDEKEDDPKASAQKKSQIDFDILPDELIAYLNQYIIGQDKAKQILAAKICTHFNRIRLLFQQEKQNCRSYSYGL